MPLFYTVEFPQKNRQKFEQLLQDFVKTIQKSGDQLNKQGELYNRLLFLAKYTDFQLGKFHAIVEPILKVNSFKNKFFA